MQFRKVLITGAGGFLGQMLARELLSRPAFKVILTDTVELSVPKGSINRHNATVKKADLIHDLSMIEEDLNAIFLLHGIMSAGSESNFELGYTVNFDATKAILDKIRHTCPGVKVIFTSAGAVYGRPYPDIIDENTLPNPESSYGAQKLMIETLINDMTRKNFVDGLSLRLPSITVRPGKPTAAASSFLSGIIREPLEGKICLVPITDREFPSWVSSPKTLIRNLVHALDLPRDSLPSHKRSVNAPGFLVTIQEMRDALAEIGGYDRLQYVQEVKDPALSRILYSWASNFDNSLGLSLGFKQDKDFKQVVHEFIAHLECERTCE